MEIFGLGIVAGCYFLGNLVGRVLGQLIGIGGNVGGVGVGMLFLVLYAAWREKKGGMNQRTAGGIKFLSAIYIPVIVAMAGKQNVVAAIDGGFTALLAGALATLAGLMFVPMIARMGDTSVHFNEE